MSRFRDEATIETKYHACPICNGHVKGNEIYKYFCKNCNILYKTEELIMTSEGVDRLLKQKIAEKMLEDSTKLKIEQDKLKPKVIDDKKREILDKKKIEIKYYVSKKSNMIHASNCPYGKNIKSHNKIILKTLEEAERIENVKKCKCILE